MEKPGVLVGWTVTGAATAPAKSIRSSIWYGALLLLTCGGMLLQRLSAWPLFRSTSLLMAAFWLAVAALAAFAAPQTHSRARLSGQGDLSGLALVGGVVFLALWYGIGVFTDCISLSPYDRSPGGIFINLLANLPVLMARETVRVQALRKAARAAFAPRLLVAGITLALALAEVNYLRLATLNGAQAWFVYLFQSILPLLAQGALLSAFALYSGAGSGILYAGIPTVFQRIFPVIPSLPWIAEAAVGITVPTVLTTLAWEHAQRNRRGSAMRRQDGVSAAFLGAMVLFVWFVVGVFPVYPLVILTGSMEPGIIPGDVVLVEKITRIEDIDALLPGDVINFQRGEINITHRIVQVQYDAAGNISFLTKGDNNDNTDSSPVLPGDIRGKITRVVPRIGLPVLLLNGTAEGWEGVVDGHDGTETSG